MAISEAKIRLVNPRTSENNTGRIEVYHPGLGWGPVCGYNWGETESGVACRQLGFTGADVTLSGTYFGRGSGPVLLLMRSEGCTGKESYIWDCSHYGWNNAPVACTFRRHVVYVECY